MAGDFRMRQPFIEREFDGEALASKLRTDVEAAVRGGKLDYEECGRLLRFYEAGLNGYTYLEERPR